MKVAISWGCHRQPGDVRQYVDNIRSESAWPWSAELLLLAKIGESQPHAMYTALIHGLFSWWHYVCVSYGAIKIFEFLQSLEDVICCTLLPAVLRTSLRNLVALPPLWGNLGVLNLTGMEWS